MQLISGCWFCILQLTFAHKISQFGVESLGFSVIKIILSINRNTFNYFQFLDIYLFIHLSCLIDPAWISCTMLSRND